MWVGLGQLDGEASPSGKRASNVFFAKKAAAFAAPGRSPGVRLANDPTIFRVLHDAISVDGVISHARIDPGNSVCVQFVVGAAYHHGKHREIIHQYGRNEFLP